MNSFPHFGKYRVTGNIIKTMILKQWYNVWRSYLIHSLSRFTVTDSTCSVVCWDESLDSECLSSGVMMAHPDNASTTAITSSCLIALDFTILVMSSSVLMLCLAAAKELVTISLFTVDWARYRCDPGSWECDKFRDCPLGWDVSVGPTQFQIAIFWFYLQDYLEFVLKLWKMNIIANFD